MKQPTPPSIEQVRLTPQSQGAVLYGILRDAFLSGSPDVPVDKMAELAGTHITTPPYQYVYSRLAYVNEKLKLRDLGFRITPGGVKRSFRLSYNG